MNSECATHCHRELFHKQWNILLDDEFLEAYEHGIVICCCDGITCRFYPRIFTYSADYPEKYVNSYLAGLEFDLTSPEYLSPPFEILEAVRVRVALFQRSIYIIWEGPWIGASAKRWNAMMTDENLW